MTHQMEAIVLALTLSIVFFGLFFYGMYDLRKSVKKEWEIVDDITDRVNSAKTKEEIETLYNEILEKSKKITTPSLQVKLGGCLYYLKGMYQQYKN